MNKTDKNLLLRRSWKIIIVSMLILALISLTLYLSNVSREIIIDVMMVLTPLFLCMLILDIIFNYYKYQKLKQIVNYSTTIKWPMIGGFIDKQYQQLVIDILNSKNKEINLLQTNSKSLEDNYVTWMYNIKGPLAALKLMIDTSNIPATKKTSAQIQIHDIQNYLNEMLNLVSLDSDNNDLKFTTIDLSKTVKSILKRNSWMFIYKQQSIEIMPDLPIWISDGRWLEIMLEQIIINASKYTPDKGKIFIGCDKQKQILRIRDTGQGIQKKDIQRIFEAGFTGQTGRDHLEATGIGLHLVGKIAGQLSLTVTVDSVMGQGTTFEIRHNGVNQ